ncbi:hypothetical protein OY671_011547, partial [Metschnikowia pulcherrima]
MQQAYEAGIPSPRVRYVLRAEDNLGSGFIMDRVEGETIPRKISRDAEFANARKVSASQLGKVVAGIHASDKSRLPELRSMTVAGEIGDLAAEYKSYDWPRPVFDSASRWSRDSAVKHGIGTRVEVAPRSADPKNSFELVRGRQAAAQAAARANQA